MPCCQRKEKKRRRRKTPQQHEYRGGGEGRQKAGRQTLAEHSLRREGRRQKEKEEVLGEAGGGIQAGRVVGPIECVAAVKVEAQK